MDKSILIQYTEVEGEIKDIQRRIERIQKIIDNLHIVSDSVKGTRSDGTYGGIRITGYPTPEFYKNKAALDVQLEMLHKKEIELLELTNQAEEFIENMDKPELRIMFRIFFIDGCNFVKTARRLNEIYPEREISFTDVNVRMRIQRYFEKM